MKSIYLTLYILFIFIGSTYAQDKTYHEFKIYVLSNKYNAEVREYINESNKLEDITIMPGSMIDPSNKGLIDSVRLLKYLNKLFPNKDDKGILCLNLENKLYDNLQVLSKENLNFQFSIQEFSKMVIFVKRNRPNLKLGIYGLPHRTFYSNQLKWNDDNKLDELLKLCDYLFPSLYIIYPDQEKGALSNDKYWSQNLDIAFEYGTRLNKEVIPFIWYMIHPSNKRHGGEIIDIQDMQRYLSFVKNYKWENNSIKGVVWWESSRTYFDKNVKYNKHFGFSKPNPNSLFLNYMKSLDF